MAEAKLNKSILIHAIKAFGTIQKAADALGVHRATIERSAKRWKVDIQALIGSSACAVENVTQMPIVRNKKPNEPRSVVSSYTGPHLGDYSRPRR